MAESGIWNKILNHPLGDMDVGISPDRLMALTDGVFAIAITLLILGIALPTSIFANSESMVNFLHSTLNRLITVIISFIILGEYWIQHHNFIKLRRINIPFLWLNIFYLLFIMFIPFTTSIICQYNEFTVSEVLFGIDITLTSVISLIMYWYALKTDLLKDEENEVEKRYALKSLSSLIYITVIIDLLMYFVSPQLLVLFLIIPLYSIFLAVKKEKTLNDEKLEIYEKPHILANIKKDKIIQFMLSSKIEDYINTNYKNYDELSKNEKKEIKKEALDDLKIQLNKIIDEGKESIED
ncbi:MAG: TMEM175 family protein [Methanobrevibacter sp.]|uniref:TMEM175 family protein n=1 Tax=Methanobrevibacter sp. TaxID=66852 RepID=UPI0026DF3477|nr:TMEM175 family protein [Methanobrevibacter sp.]MDO5848661.1 TMEM175 family protein [Methanobrevibacter sp.]